MMIGGNARSVAKRGKIQRLEVEVQGLQAQAMIRDKQVASLKYVVEELVKKLAAMGVKVEITKAGIDYRAVR